jgi:hypothetical protein
MFADGCYARLPQEAKTEGSRIFTGRNAVPCHHTPKKSGLNRRIRSAGEVSGSEEMKTLSIHQGDRCAFDGGFAMLSSRGLWV